MKSKTKSKSLQKYLKSKSKTKSLSASQQKELEKLLSKQKTVSPKAKNNFNVLLSYFSLNKIKIALDKAKGLFGTKVSFYRLLKYTVLFLIPPGVILNNLQNQGDVYNERIPLDVLIKNIRNLNTKEIKTRLTSANNLRQLRFLSEDIFDNITWYHPDQNFYDKINNVKGGNRKASFRKADRKLADGQARIHSMINNGFPYPKQFVDKFYNGKNLNDIQQLEKPTWFGFDELKPFK